MSTKATLRNKAVTVAINREEMESIDKIIETAATLMCDCETSLVNTEKGFKSVLVRKSNGYLGHHPQCHVHLCKSLFRSANNALSRMAIAMRTTRSGAFKESDDVQAGQGSRPEAAEGTA